MQKAIASLWQEEVSASQIWDLFPENNILGIGGTRLAIEQGEDRVWKLAWREQGLLDNETEYRLWQSASPELREMLCPALDLSQAGALLQKRVQPISYEALGKTGKDVIARLAEYGITDVAVNCGILEGRVVVYDYSNISIDIHKKLYGDF